MSPCSEKMSNRDPLERAIEIIQSGDRRTGRHLLAALLKSEPKNVRAWLWMSDLVDSDAQQFDCLRRVLDLDPTNTTARARLAGLGATKEQQRLAPDSPIRDEGIRHLAPDDATAGARTITSAPDGSSAASFGLSVFDDAAVPHEAPPGSEPADAAAARQSVPVNEATRKRGYRNAMAASVLSLTLMCGVVLVLITVTTVVPQARDRARISPEAVLYTARLWCPACEQEGNPVILWEKVGDGVSRGLNVGELPHNASVSVLAEEWSQREARTYYLVAASDQRGWVHEAFIRRSAPEE